MPPSYLRLLRKVSSADEILAKQVLDKKGHWA